MSTYQIYTAPETPEHITATKNRISEHKAKGLGARILARVGGKYPAPHELDAVKRHEKGPWGRSREYAKSAILWSRLLNDTPAATIKGGWVTVPVSNKYDSASISLAVTPEQRTDPDSEISRLFNSETVESIQSVGIVTPNYRYSFQKPDTFNIVGLSADNRILEQIQVDENMVQNELEASAVEALTRSISDNASKLHLRYKPDSL